MFLGFWYIFTGYVRAMDRSVADSRECQLAGGVERRVTHDSSRPRPAVCPLIGVGVGWTKSGTESCFPLSGRTIASPRPVAQRQWMPATWPSGRCHDRTPTGKQTMTFGTYHRHVRRQGALMLQTTPLFRNCHTWSRHLRLQRAAQGAFGSRRGAGEAPYGHCTLRCVHVQV